MDASDDFACLAPAGRMYTRAGPVPIAAVLLAGPTLEPVTLVDAKAWLRLSTSDEDDVVTGLIAAARHAVEHATRRRLMTQSWTLVLDRWPVFGPLWLPIAPLRAITGFRLFDDTDVATSLDPATLRLVGLPDRPRLLLGQGLPKPGRREAGIEIDVTVGYGAAATDVPAPLRQAIRMLAARWYENRAAAATQADMRTMPVDVAALIAPYRRAGLG